MKAKSNLKTLDQFVEEQYGKKGTPKRDQLEKGYESLKIGVLIQQARIEINCMLGTLRNKKVFFILLICIGLLQSCSRNNCTIKEGFYIQVNNSIENRMHFELRYLSDKKYEIKLKNLNNISPNNKILVVSCDGNEIAKSSDNINLIFQGELFEPTTEKEIAEYEINQYLKN